MSPKQKETVVEHPTVDERIERGRAARKEVPRSAHAAWEPAAGSPRSRRPARGAGGDPGPRARSAALRADAGLAVHVLSRRGLPDGRRPRGAAAHRPRDAALRRRPPLELRRLRRARPDPGVRLQRLRRDAAGSVRVGPQAPGRELRDRRARPRLRQEGPRAASTARSAAPTARRCGRMRPSATSTSGTRASTSRRSSPGRRRSGPRKQLKRAEKNVAKARSKDSLRAFGKLTETVDGELRIRNDPPVIVPIHELFDAKHHRGPGRGAADRDPLLPLDAVRRPPAAARAVPLRRRRPQGRRGRQRRDARLDHADARPRQRRPAVPAVQGGGGVGARAVPRRQRVRAARPARRRGPAADAGRRRHHARLGADQRRRRHRARLLRAPALGREGLGAGRDDEPDRARLLRRRLRPDARPRPRPSRRQRRDRRLPRRRRRASTAPWPSSRRPTPTRTSATTRRSSKPSSRGGSRPRTTSESSGSCVHRRASPGWRRSSR